MGLLQRLGFKKAKKQEAEATKGQTFSLTDPRLADLFFRAYGTSGMPQWLSFANRADYVTAWDECPAIVAILCNKAQSDINGKVSFDWATQKEGQEPVNVSKQPTARALNKLFTKPNPLQTWKQFRAQQKIYVSLFGFCPVLMVKPLGFKNPLDTTAMWNIPPQLLEIKTTGKLLFQADNKGVFEKIEVVTGAKRVELPIEDVIFLKDQYLSLDMEVLPSSRLRSLSKPISIIVAAGKAGYVAISKNGALGILSTASKDTNGPIAMSPDEVQALQKDFERYGLSEDQWQVIITNAPLAWQQMALPLKDLMLIEHTRGATMQIADAYGFPYELLAKEKGDTFTNKNEAKASFYQDTIIPESQADFEVYSDYFKLQDSNIKLCYSFDHVEVLQKSEKEKAEEKKLLAEAAKIMFESNQITLNRMRELVGEETVEGDDIYYSEHSLNQEEERSKRIPQQNQPK